MCPKENFSLINLNSIKGCIKGVAVLFFAALALVSCSEPKTSSAFSVSVNVTPNVFQEKTIGFDEDLAANGAAEISHYNVHLYEGTAATGDAYIDSEYLEAGNTYRINDITTGEYTFVVDGYIKLATEEYHKIAQSTAQTFKLSPSNDKVNVMLDGLLEESSGAISVAVTLPDDFIDTSGNYNGKLNWRITSMTDMSTPVDQGTVDKDTINGAKSGKVYTMAVDSQTAGVYMLFVDAVNDSESDTKSNADVLRLLPGLEATGEMDLNSLAVNAFDFTITDKIGTELKPVTSDGKTSYPSTDGTVVITLKETVVGENMKMLWFVDGITTNPSNEGSAYTFTGISRGLHNIVGILWDNSKEASVGSLHTAVDVARKPGIEEVSLEEVLTGQVTSSENPILTLTTVKTQLNSLDDVDNYDYYLMMEDADGTKLVDDVKMIDMSDQFENVSYGLFFSNASGNSYAQLMIGTDNAENYNTFVPNKILCAYMQETESYPLTVSLRIVPKNS